MAATMNGVKAEGALHIKDEPNDAGTPMSTVSEEVEEEDSGELAMPKDDASLPGVFLTRVPRDLWQVLNDPTISPDEPVQIGTIKVWDKGDGKQDMRMCLKHDLPGLELVPKDYEMSVTNLDPQNTFIFTEKDLPGYRPGRYNNNRQRNDRFQKRGNVRTRRSIPKKTALAGSSRHEFTLHPIENDEYYRVQRMKAQAQLAAEQSQPDIFQGDDRRNPLDAPGRQWDAFTRAKRPGQQVKKQLNKAERIPQNELIDKLVDCFRHYSYWNFKTIVKEVHQPEAYVKETLGRLAELVRTGPFANTYMLSREYQDSLNIQTAINQDAVAPQLAGEDDEVEEEGDVKGEGDSEGVEMEDVI